MGDIKFPNATGAYGAAMGRRNRRGDPDKAHKFSLRRVRIDSQGYDNGGAYWGLGQPLYYAYADDGEEIVEKFFRASSREKAKEELRKDYPLARFYR